MTLRVQRPDPAEMITSLTEKNQNQRCYLSYHVNSPKCTGGSSFFELYFLARIFGFILSQFKLQILAKNLQEGWIHVPDAGLEVVTDAQSARFDNVKMF